MDTPRADPAPAPAGIVPLPNGTFGNAHPAARTLHADAGRLKVRSVITTADPDRAGDVVNPTGVKNVEEYLLNPVRLWTNTFPSWCPVEGEPYWMGSYRTRSTPRQRG